MAREATIKEVQRYDLHGVLYYRLLVSYSAAPDSVQEVRICHDSIYDEPRPSLATAQDSSRHTYR